MGRIRASVPRFRRMEKPPPVVLTDDDIRILHHIHRHRFIRTTDLYRLMAPRSPDKLSRRLARLYRAGYLDRPISQIDSFRGEGSQPLVYGLDNAGAAYLTAQTSHGAPDANLRRRNRAYTRDNLDHALATTRFMVDVEIACRETAGVEFIAPEEILARGSGQSRAAQWSVSLPWHGHRADIVIAPDALFGLRVQREGKRPLRSFYFVEIDRGHMTIAPSERVRRSEAFLYRSSVLRKLLAYAVSHQEGAHQQHLGVPAARVLFVTTRPIRAAEMQRTTQRVVLPHLPIPVGLFLFGSLTDRAPPFEQVFRTADEKPARLLTDAHAAT